MEPTNGESVEIRPTTCEGCGVCCTYEQSPGYGRHFRQGGAAERLADTPDGRRLAAMPEELRAELAAFYAAVEDPTKPRRGPCLWYDQSTRMCRNHEWRPQICRDYETGSDDCIVIRRVHGIGLLDRSVAQ